MCVNMLHDQRSIDNYRSITGYRCEMVITKYQLAFGSVGKTTVTNRRSLVIALYLLLIAIVRL